jgi:hypothetical protein
MADKILLKRSLTSGSIPTTASLSVGELAVNVPDGKLFLRQSGSVTDSIRALLTLNTEASGSILLTGSIQSTSVTSSLFGTSSWADNAVTSSVATTASYAFNAELLDGINSTTFTTTGSNTFAGIQTISSTTNSTNYTDGALIVVGGVGIGKNVNISGSLNVSGVLTALSMSTQYVTSSQYVVGTSRVIVNGDDLVRFAGLSVIDSGSTYGTGSLLWDSLNNRWIYEADDQAYNSAILIAGPKNTGTLGNETGLTSGRIPVATGDDHIDTSLASSSIYIDFTNRKTYIEAGLYVTGSITASNNISGTLLGTASWATNTISSSYAQTSSLAYQVSVYTGSVASGSITYTGSFTGSFVGDGTLLTVIQAASASYVEFTNVANKPTLVSSSAQITYTNLSGIPSGIVSSSTQISNYNVFATTASNTFVGTETISGSLVLTGSLSIQSGSVTMPNRPAFRVTGVGGATFATTVLSGSKLNTPDFNQGSHFNTTTGLFTAPIAGLYQVNLVMRTNSNTNSTINQAIVYKSSSAGDTPQIMIEFGTNTSMNHAGGSTISSLAVGDTLRTVIAVGTCSFDVNDNFSVAYIG